MTEEINRPKVNPRWPRIDRFSDLKALLTSHELEAEEIANVTHYLQSFDLPSARVFKKSAQTILGSSL